MPREDRELAAGSSWSDRLLALGSAGHRVAQQHDNHTLIVALSLPTREFAAALIASGWQTAVSEQLSFAAELLRMHDQESAPITVTQRDGLLVLGSKRRIVRDLETIWDRQADQTLARRIVQTPHAAAIVHSRLPPDGLSPSIGCVIVDGDAPLLDLAYIDAPVVICLLDRTAPRHPGFDTLINLYRNQGKRRSTPSALGWIPPAGVEAFAFGRAL